MEHKKSDQYLKEWEAYGRKQYIPGTYTGSDMPPHVKYHRNWSLRILAGLSLLGFIGLILWYTLDLITQKG